MSRTIIGPHTRVAGALEADDDLVVEGTVEGPVRGAAEVTIAAGARVAGEVRGRDLIVGGAIDHNLYGTASVRLLQTAEVRADIEAPRIAIDDGALFEGKVKMTRKPAAATAAPVAKGPPPPAPPAPGPVASAPAAPAAREIPGLPQLGKRKLIRRTS